MEALLILVLVAALVMLAHRWHIATSGQRLADPPGPDPTPAPGTLPLLPHDQTERAMRARGTRVVPQHVARTEPAPTDPAKDAPL